MSQTYVRYRLTGADDFRKIDDPHVVLMDLQADFDKIGPYYLELGVDDMTSDPFPEYVQAIGYVKDDQLLGFLMVMHLENDGTLEIAAVSVHPQERGRGYGTALISRAAEWILERGMISSLTTGTENLAMRLAAEKIGMRSAE